MSVALPRHICNTGASSTLGTSSVRLLRHSIHSVPFGTSTGQGAVEVRRAREVAITQETKVRVAASICGLRFCGGGEFTAIHIQSAPYDCQSNSIIELVNKEVVKGGRCNILRSGRSSRLPCLRALLQILCKAHLGGGSHLARGRFSVATRKVLLQSSSPYP